MGGLVASNSVFDHVNRKRLVRVVALFAATAYASDWSKAEGAVCATLNGATEKKMYTTGFGSTACTAGKTAGTWYKGYCANEGNGKYSLQAYSDKACKTKTAAKATETNMGATFTSTLGTNAVEMTLHTCDNCPPASEDVRTTLIGGFFGIILAYSIFVCAGMYCCYGAGYRCDCTKEEDNGQKTEWWGFGNKVGGAKH